MDETSKSGGMLPSALALIDSLNQKLDTSSEPTMLTPSQLALLRRAEVEIDEWLDQSPNLKAFLRRIGRAPGAAADPKP